MLKHPRISSALLKKNPGKSLISLNGEVVAYGDNSLVAYEKAKTVMPEIDKLPFVVSKIPHKYLAA